MRLTSISLALCVGYQKQSRLATLHNKFGESPQEFPAGNCSLLLARSDNNNKEWHEGLLDAGQDTRRHPPQVVFAEFARREDVNHVTRLEEKKITRLS